MNNYDIENKLRNKTDKWEIHNLNNKLSQLENKNLQLQKENNYYQGRLNNQGRAIDTILGLLINKELMPEFEDTLQSLRQYL